MIQTFSLKIEKVYNMQNCLIHSTHHDFTRCFIEMLQVTISDKFRFEAKLCSKFIDKYQITLATTVNVLSVALTEKKYFYCFFFALLTSNIIIRFLLLFIRGLQSNYDVKQYDVNVPLMFYIV